MATSVTKRPSIEMKPEFASILREQVEFSTGNNENVSDQINGWFDKLILQSGMGLAPVAFLLLCVLSAVTCGGIALLATDRFVPMLLAGIVGIAVPILTAVFLRSRRQRQMTHQMPAMIEELSRAARTGRSIEQCFHMVASDTPAPLGPELQASARKSQMGLDLSSAIKDLPERTGLTSLTTFVTALSVHQETGGDLIKVLDRLAQAVRDRMLFVGRLKAATTASTWTAFLMLGIPPAVLLFFIFRDPDYFTRLMSSPWGRLSFWTAIILQVIGAASVLMILRRSHRA